MRVLIAALVVLMMALAVWQVVTPQGRDLYCKTKLNTDPFLCDGEPFTFE